VTGSWLALLVALGGGVGAVARFALDGALRRWQARRSQARRWQASRRAAGVPAARSFPTAMVMSWPTGVVNVSGSLVLGVLAGLAAGSAGTPAWLAVLGTGWCGGYTTFSTASVEVVTMLRRRAWTAAAATAVGSLVLTTTAAAAGFALAGG
jgi:CrcB protein